MLNKPKLYDWLLLCLSLALYPMALWGFCLDEHFIAANGMTALAQGSVFVAWMVALGLLVWCSVRWRCQRRSWVSWLCLCFSGLMVILPLAFVAMCFIISFLLAVPIL